MSVLQTDRLLLRPISIADFEAHARITADPEVMRFIHDGPLSRVAAWWNVARYVGHWHLRGYGMWSVVERLSGQVIGHLGFLKPEGGYGFELGWALARSAWGHGYALEGARAAVAYGFSALDERHIICVIHAENRRSIRIAERLGAGLERQVSEGDRLLLIYGIHREEPAAA